MCDICHRTPHAAGCPNAPAPKYPRCPRCGREPELFFVDRSGEIVGCERCLIPREWYQLEKGGGEV